MKSSEESVDRSSSFVDLEGTWTARGPLQENWADPTMRYLGPKSLLSADGFDLIQKCLECKSKLEVLASTLTEHDTASFTLSDSHFRIIYNVSPGSIEEANLTLCLFTTSSLKTP